MAKPSFQATSSYVSGTQWHPDANVGMGKDHTVFSLIEGNVAYRTKANGKVYVSVMPKAAEAAE